MVRSASCLRSSSSRSARPSSSSSPRPSSRPRMTTERSSTRAERGSFSAWHSRTAVLARNERVVLTATTLAGGDASCCSGFARAHAATRRG
eukprot:7024481-Prymnesium_polylepis.2